MTSWPESHAHANKTFSTLNILANRINGTGLCLYFVKSTHCRLVDGKYLFLSIYHTDYTHSCSPYIHKCGGYSCTIYSSKNLFKNNIILSIFFSNQKMPFPLRMLFTYTLRVPFTFERCSNEYEHPVRTTTIEQWLKNMEESKRILSNQKCRLCD